MPLYDFKCTQCGSEVEHMVSRETETLPCESCGHTATRMVPLPAGHYWHTKNPPEGAKRSGIHREEARGKKHERQKQHWKDDFGDSDYK